MANDTSYGLASAVFSKNINRAIKTAHAINAGTAWVSFPAHGVVRELMPQIQVNCVQSFDNQVPFGGYKQSGIGRELGEYALSKYVLVVLFSLFPDIYDVYPRFSLVTRR